MKRGYEDVDGPLQDWSFWTMRRVWPGLRNLWLWVAQGRPLDFPIVEVRGVLEGEWDAERCVVRLTRTRDWTFSQALMRPGSLSGHALVAGLTRRYPVDIRYPDGHVERKMVQPPAES